MPQLIQHAGRRHRRLPFHIRAVNLDVDGRGQSEIQNLGDDVGGQEVEGRAGKSRGQLSPQLRAHSRLWDGALRFKETRMSASAAPITPDVACMMLIPLYGKPMLSRMLVNLAWRNLAADASPHLSQSRAVSSMRVPVLARTCKYELAGVGGREKVLAEPRDQTERQRRTTAQKPGNEISCAGVQAGGQQELIGRAQSLRSRVQIRAEIGLNKFRGAGRPMAALRLQQIHGQRRNQRPREHVGGEHREHHRFGQRHEQVSAPRRSRKNIGRNTMQMQSVETKRRHGDLRRAVQDAVRRSLPSSKLRSMFSIVTVASSTRMPTASARPPSVMMLMVSPSALRTHDGSQDRERNRDRDDQRAAPASEEQQDHHAR